MEQKNILGQIETNNTIKNIIIKNNELYEINNNEEILLNYEFNKNYINIEYILNEIKQNNAFIQEKENIKTYLYEIENDNENITKIYVKCNEENIKEIKINELDNEYILNFENN